MKQIDLTIQQQRGKFFAIVESNYVQRFWIGEGSTKQEAIANFLRKNYNHKIEDFNIIDNKQQGVIK
jgi:hypothetical protein